MVDSYFPVGEMASWGGESVLVIFTLPLLFAKLSLYGKWRLTLASQAGMSRIMGNLLLFE